MTNDTNDQTQPTLWGLPERAQVVSPARGVARARSRPVPPESVGEVGELWSIDQVADYLGVSKQSIYGWRATGYGPRGFRVGKHLRWRATTVLAWTVDCERDQ